MKRTFQINYTKNGERKSFITQDDHFYENDEWRFVVERFNILGVDQAWDDKAPQTYKTRCLGAGYSDVTFVELP